MSENKPMTGSRTVFKLIMAGIALSVVVFAVLYVKDLQRKNCDRAAKRDITKISACLERLNNELVDLGCESKWEFEKKQLAFLVGPYYGWGGTNHKCKVKIRVENEEVWGCSLKGTNQGDDGDKRLIYRAKFKGGEELTPTMGSCFGQAYGGAGDQCFTDSIVNKDCSPAYRFKSKATPEEKSVCRSMQRSLESNLDNMSRIVTTSINPFGIDMYRAFISDDDNFFFGPLTAYGQFYTTAEITRAETRQEILAALRLKETTAKDRSSIETLLKAVRCSVILGGGQFTISDAFCGRRPEISGNDFFKPFDTSLTKKAGSSIDQSQRIECEQNPNTFTVGWKNISHFLGKWSGEAKFDPKFVEEGDFFTMKRGKVKTSLMFKWGHSYKYNESDGVQVLEIPYAGEKVSMLILLPREKKGLPKLEKSLTEQKLKEWVKGLTLPMDGVQVWLPRFGVSSQPDFTKSLQGLGIKRLFLMGQCQFKTTGMPLYDKNPDLAIMPSKMSNMSQQAWIDVDEKGTEAYVAGINCGEILASDGAAEASRTPKPVIFRADHPFLFIVRHVDTGAIVFMGRLMNP